MPRRAPESLASTSGFTLLEVIVALVIAGLALGVLLRAAATGLWSTRTAAAYEEALSRAQSHLEAIGAPGVNLQPRVETGDDGSGFHWQVVIRQLTTETVSRQHYADPKAPAPQLVLFAVRVIESWKNGTGHGSVTLATRRVRRL